jgi:hypothetical protein
MKWWIGSFTCISLACSGKNNLPSGVLGHEEMQDVVWDMIQADQYYREYTEKDSLTKNVKQERYKLYEEVFKIHKISRATFDKSFAFYTTHPQLMRDVFDSLSIEGNRKLRILQELRHNRFFRFKKAKPKLDSARSMSYLITQNFIVFLLLIIFQVSMKKIVANADEALHDIRWSHHHVGWIRPLWHP